MGDETKRTERAQRALDDFSESRKFWARKWYDYLTIGNGGALLACMSALIQSRADAKLLMPSAWCFFVGLIAGGLLPKIRFSILITHQQLYRVYRRPKIIGEFAPRMTAASVGRFIRAFKTWVARLLELTSGSAFCLGSLWALRSIS